MNKISELKEILSDNLHWNKARIDCLSRLLLALFAVRTVNLSELATAFGSESEINSRYRRLQRFFALFELDYTVLASWIFKLFFWNSDQSFYVVIDRTNWYWGRKKINVFTLGIAYEGLAIPLFWTLLPKAGNSNFNEQKMLIKRFTQRFGKAQILGLLADREFGHGNLFNWLNKEKIPFYIRIKEGSLVNIRTKKWLTAKKLFKDVCVKTEKSFLMAVDVFEAHVYLSASRSERGELMIIATNQTPKNAIPVYLRRWEIESLFQGLKGRGFRFEETHITQLDRIEKLMGVLAIAFCWAHKVGEWKAQIKKAIPFKQHYNGLRLQNSFFRYGFDHIRDIVVNPFNQKIAIFRECLRLFYYQPPLLEAVS
jgi:Transposase DDE domain